MSLTISWKKSPARLLPAAAVLLLALSPLAPLHAQEVEDESSPADQPLERPEEAQETAAPRPAADDAATPTTSGGRRWSGAIEFGGRAVRGSLNSGKFEEYRDVRRGPFGNLSLTTIGTDGRYLMEGNIRDFSERDQRYDLRIRGPGRYQIELNFAEFPHTFSRQARTLYTTEGAGALVLPDTLQAGIAGAGTPAAQSAALGAALETASPVEVAFQLRRGGAATQWRLLPDVSLDLGYNFLWRNGNRPYSMAFGSPGNNFVNVAAPIHHWIHDVVAGVDFTPGDWAFRLEYNGSFFDNRITNLTVDNPLAAADTLATGASRGRLDLLPDNTAHTFRVSAARALPVGFPLRLSAAAAYGRRNQDAPFLSHTVNTAIADPSLELPQGSLDGLVQTWLATVRATARPVRNLDLTARYRFYDFDNDTPNIVFPGHVLNDRTLVAEERSNNPYEYQRHDASAWGWYRVARPLRLGAGYEFKRWNRSEDREVRQLNEHWARAGVNFGGGGPWQARLGYALALRDRASPYHTYANLENALPPGAAEEASRTGQSTLLRKFDQSNRTLNRLDLQTSWMQSERLQLGLSATGAIADYRDVELGLLDRRSWGAGADATYQLMRGVRVGAFYSFEYDRREQKSRWRPRTFAPPIVVVDDPANDWSSRLSDYIHTAGFNGEIAVIPDTLALNLQYAFTDGAARTRASGAPGFAPAPTAPGAPTPADGGNAPDWPTIHDRLHVVETALRFTFWKNFALRGAYRFEYFDLDSFKFSDLRPFEPGSNVGGSGAVGPSLDVFLGDALGDYNAHIFELSLIYNL